MEEFSNELGGKPQVSIRAVSYTHLDVYKRQGYNSRKGVVKENVLLLGQCAVPRPGRRYGETRCNSDPAASSATGSQMSTITEVPGGGNGL